MASVSPVTSVPDQIHYLFTLQEVFDQVEEAINSEYNYKIIIKFSEATFNQTPARYIATRYLAINARTWLRLSPEMLCNIHSEYNLTATQTYGMLINLIKFGIENNINLPPLT